MGRGGENKKIMVSVFAKFVPVYTTRWEIEGGGMTQILRYTINELSLVSRAGRLKKVVLMSNKAVSNISRN